MENQRALENLQSKDWPYFINRFLEVSNDDIFSLSLLGIGQNQNNIEQLKIVNDTIENLKICKNYYADVYANVSSCFQNYLKIAPSVLNEKMQDDLRTNFFSNIYLNNELNTSEILQTFDGFFFSFRRFPGINGLTVVPIGDVPSFAQSSDVILPSELYKRYNSCDIRRLVCVHFLVALNVHLGSNKMISKNAMSVFFHNLSM